MKEKIRVAVAGAAGKMGEAAVKAVSAQPDFLLVSAIDPGAKGKKLGFLQIGDSLEDELLQNKPDVLVDFTRRDAALGNIQIALKHRVACVVGTTGFTEADESKIEAWCNESGTPVLLAPNFAVGAVLMMKFAEQASKYYNWAEIVELHHEQKIDAPSGTALRTSKLMRNAAKKNFAEIPDEKLSVPGVRGGIQNGVTIHSIRLPGLLAHQEVLFGGPGETLTIRHDSTAREAFMPGVMLAIRKIKNAKGLIAGLENFLE